LSCVQNCACYVNYAMHLFGQSDSIVEGVGEWSLTALLRERDLISNGWTERESISMVSCIVLFHDVYIARY